MGILREEGRCCGLWGWVVLWDSGGKRGRESVSICMASASVCWVCGCGLEGGCVCEGWVCGGCGGVVVSVVLVSMAGPCCISVAVCIQSVIETLLQCNLVAPVTYNPPLVSLPSSSARLSGARINAVGAGIFERRYSGNWLGMEVLVQ